MSKWLPKWLQQTAPTAPQMQRVRAAASVTSQHASISGSPASFFCLKPSFLTSFRDPKCRKARFSENVSAETWAQLMADKNETCQTIRHIKWGSIGNLSFPQQKGLRAHNKTLEHDNQTFGFLLPFRLKLAPSLMKVCFEGM